MSLALPLPAACGSSSACGNLAAEASRLRSPYSHSGAPAVTIQRLQTMFDYDQQTGRLFWKATVGVTQAILARNARYAGKEAGFVKRDGYRYIEIENKEFLAHRICWAIHYGEWPPFRLDHRNLIGSDNPIENLRAASSAQNMANRGIQKNNTSGAKGVHFHKKSGKWYASIKVQRTSHHLGSFSSKEDAIKTYDEACVKLHGDFARPNQLQEAPHAS